MKGARLLLVLLFSLFLLTSPLEPPLPPSPTLTEQYLFPVELPLNVDNVSISKSPMQGDTSRQWTLLIYMAVDGSSETAALADIKEMEQVGSNDQINILVYVDFETNSSGVQLGASTYNITQDRAPAQRTISSPPLTTPLATDPNMGDPTTLLHFILFGQNYSAADHYLLILWGLGAGYEGVCFDEGNDDWLLPHEIATVFENATIEPIDIVAFDASFMGQLEVLYELCDSTDLLLSSENRVPQEHLPYHIFLYSLTLFPTSTPLALAAEIGFRYIEAFSLGGSYYTNYTVPLADLCISVVSTNHLSSVVNWITRLMNTLLAPNILLQQYSGVCGARGKAIQFALPQVIDLGAFGYQLAQQFPLLVTGSLGYNLSLSVLSAVSYERHMSGLTGASGLSISFAEHGSASLAFLNDTRFEEFVQAFHAIGGVPASALFVPMSGRINGYLDGVNDSLYFRWVAQISVVHTVQLLAFQTSDDDFDLSLYDANLNLLTRSVDITSTETIQYAVVQGQTYYICVTSYSGEDVIFGLGACQLIITASSGINPIVYVLLAGTIVGIAVLTIIFYLGFRCIWMYVSKRRQHKPTAKAVSAGTIATLKPEPSNQTHCLACGEEYPPGARFCPKCGGNSSGQAQSRDDSSNSMG